MDKLGRMKTPTNRPRKILICDDHPVCCYGLKASLEAVWSNNGTIFQFAHSGERALELAEAEKFDYLFMDMKLPAISGIDVIQKLSYRLGETNVVIMTSYTEAGPMERLKQAIQTLPIHGVLQKTHNDEVFRTMIDHLEENRAGVFMDDESRILLDRVSEVQLTKREMEVVQLIAEGKTAKEIAELLGCSFETVKSHRTNILFKTKVRNAAELGAWFSERYGKSSAGSHTLS
ncbi:MAG: response regulator transcription factor [Bdellovibrionaceae bacterium]|nr:response regulator transcription factor [Pseudobdellovibrionaceae bacterium]